MNESSSLRNRHCKSRAWSYTIFRVQRMHVTVTQEWRTVLQPYDSPSCSLSLMKLHSLGLLKKKTASVWGGGPQRYRTKSCCRLNFPGRRAVRWKYHLVRQAISLQGIFPTPGPPSLPVPTVPAHIVTFVAALHNAVVRDRPPAGLWVCCHLRIMLVSADHLLVHRPQ